MSLQEHIDFISSETNVFGAGAKEAREIAFGKILDELKQYPDAISVFRAAKKHIFSAAIKGKIRTEVSFEQSSIQDIGLFVALLSLQGFAIHELGFSKVYVVSWSGK